MSGKQYSSNKQASNLKKDNGIREWALNDKNKLFIHTFKQYCCKLLWFPNLFIQRAEP